VGENPKSLLPEKIGCSEWTKHVKSFWQDGNLLYRGVVLSMIDEGEGQKHAIA